MGRLLVLALVAGLLLAVVPVASAATPADRAAARSFAAAGDLLAKRARAALPLSLVSTQQASLDCHLAGVRRARDNGVGPTAIIRASLEGLAIARSIIYLTAVPHVDDFVKRLDRVRHLRSGAARRPHRLEGAPEEHAGVPDAVVPHRHLRPG